MPLSGPEMPAATSVGLALGWLFPYPSDPGIGLDLQEGQDCVIGRNEDCSVCLAGVDLSRRHARIHRQDGNLVLSDLNSRNGTFVNGHRTTSAYLALNDIVRFGGRIGVIAERIGPTLELAPGLMAGPLMSSVLEPALRAAPSDLPIILEGETGTGKEVVARTIHAWSCRRGPFVAVNCAALPESLAEGELFGYRRGAFTGADRASPGFFRSAEGGTLLLDEVSDMPLGIQAKLLRVLEQGQVQPLGEAQPVSIDVRVIVATQEPLSHAVQQKKFRADLLARLSGLNVNLPPLRRRPCDVLPLLLRHLGKLIPESIPAFDVSFAERLCIYDWPFNVREVVQLAKRIAVLHADQTCLSLIHLPSHMAGEVQNRSETNRLSPPPLQIPSGPPEFPSLIAALRASRGNVAQAAAMLGISRQRAYRLMQGHAVELESLRGPNEEPP